MDKYQMADKLAFFLECAENGIRVKSIGNIKGFEDFEDNYFILSTGEVWSKYKKEFLKPYFNSDGYHLVDLRNGECRKQARVHRLVALAFIPNPDNLPTVNHKDECHTNNDISNLEWMSIRDNIRYGTGTKRSAEHRKKPVICVETGEVFPSVKEAADYYQVSYSNIFRALKNPRHTSGGVHWQRVCKENNND